MSEVEVTQADRDAAASGYYAWCSGNPTIPNRMVEGSADDHSMIQAFARHRIAAEEGKAELVEAAEALRDDMLERARIAALLRKDAAVIVEAGNGVWLRFNEALARVRGEG